MIDLVALPELYVLFILLIANLLGIAHPVLSLFLFQSKA